MPNIKFLTDVHIPLAAIEALQKKEIDIIRTLDAGFAQDEIDETLLEYATAEQRVLLTCDRGFEKRCFERQAQGQQHASIIYFSMSNGDCDNIKLIIEWVELVAETANSQEDAFNQVWRAT